jgi:hypothetical protein
MLKNKRRGGEESRRKWGEEHIYVTRKGAYLFLP